MSTPTLPGPAFAEMALLIRCQRQLRFGSGALSVIGSG